MVDTAPEVVSSSCVSQACSEGIGMINSLDYSAAVRKMRRFFEKKGWIEVHTQSRLSILAACEDPNTISTYNYAGQVWPLPQTGQMWLEYELLKNPEWPGVFCVSTSFRNEPNPVPGRHDKVFPMFEFEMRGSMDDLVKVEAEMLEYVGFGSLDEFAHKDYRKLAEEYGVVELEHEHEERMSNENGDVVFLKDFPNHTSPFWNMKQADDGVSAKKVDVIMHGVETIGSAERSTNVEEMKEMFYNISDGGYANILFANFTKERVEQELEEFLKFDFFERCGGGIGVTRMIRAMKLSGILHEPLPEDVRLAELEAEARAKDEVSKLEEELLLKTKRSRCWGLPVAPSDKRKRNLGAAIGAATVAAGEKAMEVAAEHAASLL